MTKIQDIDRTPVRGASDDVKNLLVYGVTIEGDVLFVSLSKVKAENYGRRYVKHDEPYRVVALRANEISGLAGESILDAQLGIAKRLKRVGRKRSRI